MWANTLSLLIGHAQGDEIVPEGGEPETFDCHAHLRNDEQAARRWLRDALADQLAD